MRSRWLGFVVAVLALALSLWAFPRLPPAVPTHWNLRGDVDGYSSRLVAALLLPLIMLGLRALVALLPRIDPLRENYQSFMGTYWLIVNAVLLFTGAIHAVVIANGLGFTVNPARLVPVGLGLLFIVLGNVLTRVRPNWFVGIRTPWTLSSERVWRQTHRAGGWLLVGGGILVLSSAFAPRVAVMPLMIVTIGVVAVVPVVYSYILWREEQREGSR